MNFLRQQLKRIYVFWPWMLLSLGLTIAPYVWVVQTTPEGYQFLGSLINTGDLSVYLSAIRQGADGAWLFDATFTPELITPKISHTFYLAIGRFANLFQLDSLLVFHGSRVLAGLLLLCVVAIWLNFLEIDTAVSDAFFLIFLSGGWGWLAFRMGWVLPDVHVAEWTPFLSIFHAPHFTLGIVSEILIMTALLMVRLPSSRYLWAIGLGIGGGFGLSLVYPYRIIPVGLAIGVYVLLETGWNWRQNLHLLHTAFWSLAVLGGMSVYYGIVARTDPLWEVTNVAQNRIPSPNPLESFLGLGLVGLLALPVGRIILAKGWKPLPIGIRLCLIWFGVGAFCLYLPVSFQGRFSLNMYLPLAVVAAWSLHHSILPRLELMLGNDDRQSPSPVTANRVALYHKAILFFAFPTILMSLNLIIFRPGLLPEYYFIANPEVQAAEWLAHHGQQKDLVLAGPQMGNYLPRYFSGRVFVGQYYITVDSEHKIELVEQFFDPMTTAAWRSAFLQEWGIDYIYYGEYESKMGPFPDLDNWVIVYENDGVQVYSSP